MSKKIILGLVGLLVIGSAVVAGTRAYFSQTGEVKSNTFSTGNLSLKLNEAESATAAWKIETGKPGDSVSGTVKIKNGGTVEADHIEITALNEVEEAVSGPGTKAEIPLDTVLEITALTYEFGPGDVRDLLALGYVTDEDGNKNGIVDLDDLEGKKLDNLSLTDLGVDHPLLMTVRFHPVLTVAEHQGDSATTTLTVTLNQVASQ